MNLLQRICLAAALIASPMAGCGSDDKPSKSGPECGNGVVDTLADGAAAEECDKMDLGGATCASATMKSGSTGTLTCSATCTLVTTGCSSPSTGGTGGAGGSGGTVVMGGMGGMVMGGMGGMNDASSSGGSGGSTGGSSTGGSDASTTSDASVDASDSGNGRGQP